jgi:hypothetical protein
MRIEKWQQVQININFIKVTNIKNQVVLFHVSGLLLTCCFLQESLAEHVLFFDDDLNPDVGCVQAYLRAMQKYPEVRHFFSDPFWGSENMQARVKVDPTVFPASSWPSCITV